MVAAPATYSLFPSCDSAPNGGRKSIPSGTVNHTPRPRYTAQSSEPLARESQRVERGKMEYSAIPQMARMSALWEEQYIANRRAAGGDPRQPLEPCRPLFTGFSTRTWFPPKPTVDSKRRPVTALEQSEHGIPLDDLNQPSDSLRRRGTSARTTWKHTKGALTSARFGTLTPSTLATLATGSSTAKAGPGHRLEVTEKAVSCDEDGLLRWRPRPSSPALMESLSDFDSAPRAPPPTPLQHTPCGSQSSSWRAGKVELMSAWDSDDEEEEEDGHELAVMDDEETVKLLDRVKRLSLTKTRRWTASNTPLSSVSNAITRRCSKRDAGKKSQWRQSLLCAC